MKKVAFVIEKDDPRLPLHQHSIDGYSQKKIKTLIELLLQRGKVQELI